MALDDNLNFDVSTDADHDVPNISFRLSGVYAAGHQGDDGETKWTESFEAFGILPMGGSYSLKDAFIEDDGTGQRGVNPAAVIEFMRAVLATEDDQRRFMALINDRARLIKLEVLAKVMQTLVNKQTSRPTGGR